MVLEAFALEEFVFIAALLQDVEGEHNGDCGGEKSSPRAFARRGPAVSSEVGIRRLDDRGSSKRSTRPACSHAVTIHKHGFHLIGRELKK